MSLHWSDFEGEALRCDPCGERTSASEPAIPVTDEMVERAGGVIAGWAVDPSRGGPREMLRAALEAALTPSEEPLVSGSEHKGDSQLHVVLRAHDAYVEPLNGGYHGYQAACWDCDWTGTGYLRGDEPMGSDASRAHKIYARREAAEHRATNQIACCSKCKRALNDEDGRQTP